MTSNDSTNGAEGSSYTVPLFINGKEVTTETTFPVVSPGTSHILWHASSASVADALSAVEAAAAVCPQWSSTKPNTRRAILLKAADLLEARAQECIDIMMQETGAVTPFSKFNVDTTVEMLRDIAGRIVSALQGEIPVCLQEGTSALVLKEPFGVVLGIAPWYERPLVVCDRTNEADICLGMPPTSSASAASSTPSLPATPSS
jgi:acyl-CoA reductase-like NAD-dependent aldehyde dehydrogenase